MQVAYQSDESDDTSSYDETFCERKYEEEEDDEDEKGNQNSNVHVDRRSEADDDQAWWQQQLGPRTRRKARVNYNEVKIIPAETPTKVRRDLLNLLKASFRVWSNVSTIHRIKRPYNTQDFADLSHGLPYLVEREEGTIHSSGQATVQRLGKKSKSNELN